MENFFWKFSIAFSLYVGIKNRRKEIPSAGTALLGTYFMVKEVMA